MFFWPGNLIVYRSFSSYDELWKLQGCQNLVKTNVFTMFCQVSGCCLARVFGSVWAPNSAIQATKDDQRNPRCWANGIPESFQGYQSLLGDPFEIPKICSRQPREPCRAFRACWCGFWSSEKGKKELFSRLPRLHQHQLLAARLVQWCLCWRQAIKCLCMTHTIWVHPTKY